MPRKPPAPIPWVGTLFLCSPLLGAAALSGSVSLLWLSVGVAGASLGLWHLLRRARNKDMAALCGCSLLFVLCFGLVLAPFLIYVLREVTRYQTRPAAICLLSLGGGYLAVRLLAAGRKDAVLRAAGLIVLGASLFGIWSSAFQLKWLGGPELEDCFGWRFKWNGPESEKPEPTPPGTPGSPR